MRVINAAFDDAFAPPPTSCARNLYDAERSHSLVIRHLTLGDWFVERYESKGLGAAYSVFAIAENMVDKKNM